MVYWSTVRLHRFFCCIARYGQYRYIKIFQKSAVSDLTNRLNCCILEHTPPAGVFLLYRRLGTI